MSIEWVVLSLTPQGEDEDPDVLRKALCRLMKGAEIFIPASIYTVGDSRVVHKLIDNYVFVKRTFSDAFFLKLEDTRYIASILTYPNSHGAREISCVKELDIAKMRRQLFVETEQGIEIGDQVEVMSGPYKGIFGSVVEEIPENASVQVYISLRSKQALVTLPRSFLRFVSKSKGDQPLFSPFLNKITRIHEWVSKARPFVLLTFVPTRTLLSSYGRVIRFGEWLQRVTHLSRVQDSLALSESLQGSSGSTFPEVYRRFRQMFGFVNKEPALFHFSRIPACNINRLQTKYLEYMWLQDVIQRVREIQESVDIIGKSISDWKPSMVQNVIFDGHNLAHRVVNALRNNPNQLTDSDGSPTSLIFGFLRSLAAIKKRFPRANMYVVWDGSKQRRASVYPDYKANRPTSNGCPDNQIVRLKEILPFLGVFQAYNPDEETDDLIACLVRGRLRGQHNIIISTDRDFLQLVTYTDILLVPKVGTRKEVIYDPDGVVKEYGVPPKLMVHLRSLLGDTSDNLPGVPRVPRKVLVSLINSHGSLDGVLASNLSGTTTSQYEKIREFESQARLNFRLMALEEGIECPITEPTPNEESAVSLLSSSEIQPESIVGTFFPDHSSQGFHKTT